VRCIELNGFAYTSHSKPVSFSLIATSPNSVHISTDFTVAVLCKSCQSNLFFQPCFQIPYLRVPANHVRICYSREQCIHFLKVLIVIFKGVK
jgi:hypothetical protein